MSNSGGRGLMSKKDTAQEFKPDDFEKLDEELNQLVELIRQFSSNPDNYEIKPRIQYLLAEMFSLSKKIGGNVLDHADELKLDINAFLDRPNTKGLAPKIFQDFQLLKNDLRRL